MEETTVHPEMLKALIKDAREFLPDADDEALESAVTAVFNRATRVGMPSLNRARKRIEDLESILEDYRNPVVADVSLMKATRAITGALKDCIETHGPIDKTWTGSAAKRVMSSLFQIGLLTRDEKRLARNVGINGLP